MTYAKMHVTKSTNCRNEEATCKINAKMHVTKSTNCRNKEATYAKSMQKCM